MTNDTRKAQAETLRKTLGLDAPPLAILFSHEAPEGVPEYESDPPEPTPDGRTGKVTAGCVFWGKAAAGTFTTRPPDHANCNVGSYTHGFQSLEEAAKGADVAALLESGWVRAEDVPSIPQVRESFGYVTYGPLADAPGDPDVVFLHVNAKQAMILADGIPEMRIEGKPQCHIIAIARESNEVAASVGCMLSRVRTGMRNADMTCAIPGRRLAEVIDRLEAAAAIDRTVAAYAAEDAKRFA